MSMLIDSNGHRVAKQTKFYFTAEPATTPTDHNAPLIKYKAKCLRQMAQALIDAGVDI